MTNHCNKEVILTLFILFIHTSYAAVDSDFLTYYDLKVQRNEATCRLVNHANLPSDRLTLAGRDCMCDEECVEYKDCCKDSRYYRPNEQSYPSPYHCSETTAVYMKTVCASTWDSDELTQHCANSIQPLRSEDFHLILPVVNQRTRITYGNRYCAMCNHDQDESNWLQFPLDVSCGLAPPGFLKKPPAPETPPPSYHYNKQAEYDRPIFSEKISEFDSSENERCNNSTSKVINNIFHQPSPGFILDINLYITNDSSIGILNGKNALRLPFQLQNVISSDFRDGNNFLKRRKRQHDHVDFEKYSHLAEKICATAKYDSYNDEFVSHYQNKYYICRYRALLPENAENYTRTCVPFVQNKCPDGFKNEIIKEECAIHTKIVYNKQTKKPYRNKDCARCNGEKEESLDGKPQLTRSLNTDSKKKNSEGTNEGMHAGFKGVKR